MVAYFQLQPPETDVQQLAEQYWREIGKRIETLKKQRLRPAK